MDDEPGPFYNREGMILTGSVFQMDTFKTLFVNHLTSLTQPFFRWVTGQRIPLKLCSQAFSLCQELLVALNTAKNDYWGIGVDSSLIYLFIQHMPHLSCRYNGKHWLVGGHSKLNGV